MKQFHSGYACKKVGKLLAGAIGVVYLGSHVAQKNGYIMDYSKLDQVNEVLVEHIDFNHDGKVDLEDLHIGACNVQSHLGVTTSSVAGFGSGFTYAFFMS